MSDLELKNNIKNLNITLKNVFNRDYECEPSIQETLLSIKNGWKIYPDFQETLQKIANMVDDIINKVQYVYNKVEEYNIQIDEIDTMPIRFFDTYRAFCSQLKSFVTKLSQDSTNIKKDEYSKLFVGLLDSKKRFDKRYTEMLEYINELEQQNIEVLTPTYKKRFWSITKWIYQYKFILYISGILIYNTYYYSFGNDIDSFVDVMIKICGSVCYSFMSDPVLKTKLLNTVSSFTTLIVYMIYSWLPLSNVMSYFLSKFPTSIKKIFNVSRTILFYIFVNFVMEWVTYIIQVICQSIIILGEGFAGRLPSYSSVIWSKFEEIKQSFLQSYERAAVFIKENVIQHLDVLLKGLVKFFMNVVYQDTIKPVFSKIKNAVFSPLDLFSGFGNMFSSEKSGEQLSGYLTESKIPSTDAEMSLMEIQNMLIDQKEYSSALVEQFSESSVEVKEMIKNTLEHFKDTEEIVLDSYEQLKQSFGEKFKENIMKSGSLKLWNDIINYRFDKINMVYILFLLFLFEFIKIIFT